MAGKTYPITYAVINSFTAADVDESKPARSVLTGGTMAVSISAVPGHDLTITGYQITVNDNVPPDPAGDGWQTEITEFALPAGTADGLLTLYAWVRQSNDFIGVKTYTTTYCTGAEIDKSWMTATVSSTDNVGTAAKTINSLPDDAWRCAQSDAATSWVRMDLGGRYDVTRFIYMGNPATENHRVKDYRLYVTDVDSTSPSDWGSSVKAGSFANVPATPVPWPQWGTPQVVVLDPPVSGKYVILCPLNTQNGWTCPGVSELWAYGTPAVTVSTVDSFTATDVDEANLASTVLTSGTMFVSISATLGDGVSIDGYKITVNDNAPPDPDGEGWLAEITEFTMPEGTPEGFVTLYAWVRDSASQVAGKPYMITYCSGTPIDKSLMAVAASSSDGYLPAGVINNVSDDGWRCANSDTNPWLRLDLGGRYDVTRFLYMGNPGSSYHRIKDYQVYVTDVDSPDPADWGSAVKSGTFASLPMPPVTPPQWGTPQLAKLDWVATGRYVILRAASAWEAYPGASEVWVYGTQAVTLTTLDTFTAADADELNPARTALTSGTLAVTLAATAGTAVTITGYQIVVNSNTPPDPNGTGWETDVTQLTLPADTPEGLVTLYAWVRDSSGYLIGKTYAITCCTGTEISKSLMTATASSSDDHPFPANVINNLPDDAWRCSNNDPAPWIRFDLGGRYDVTRFVYMGNPGTQNHRIKDYEIYVTDADSPNRADWGSVDKSGTFANVPGSPVAYPQWGVPQVVKLDTPAAGKFVILRPLNQWAHWPGASEVWVYGTPAIALTTLDSFTAADADETNPARTVLTGGTLAVAIAATPGTNVTVNGYQIIVNNNAAPNPAAAGWQSEITQSSLPVGTPEGMVTLYAWVRDSSNYVAGRTYQITYCTGTPIDKALMTATASSTDGVGTAPQVINNLPDDAWRVAEADTNRWLRIDLGGPCSITRFLYMGNPATENHRIKDYELYITDADSPNPADWGTPRPDGTFADLPFPAVASNQWGTPQIVKLDPPVTARYVILRPLSQYASRPGASEVWVYGRSITAGPMITAFTLADQSTGSTLFTNAADVNASITVDPNGPAAAAFLITTTADKPDPAAEGWAAAITSVSLASQGSVTLYAWAKDADGNVGDGVPATIYFSTAVPAVSNVQFTTVTPGTAVTITWDTDIPAEGSVTHGPVKMSGITPDTAPEGAVGTSHSVTVSGLTDGTNYKLLLVNNEIAATEAIYWPLPWPIEGDANMDCRVNILDLIFIRNKLNQPAGTGDNWKADVNQDTRINILDLIFVRNKLNTQCP